METPFFGGSYPGFSTNLANDRTINLYPELVETKQGKQIGALYSTPGQRALLTLPNFGVGTVMGPCRGSRTMATTNKMIQVYGNTVMTVDTNNITVLLGHINTSTGPVDIIDNGTQVAVSDGYQLWAYTLGATATASLITTLPSAPGVLVIQDGFGLTNILGTDQFYQSNLNDLTTWGALNFSSADAEPSPIIGMATLFRQVWIFKQNTSEVWNNVGGVGFTFQRMQGVYLQVGCQAPYSVATSGERVIWLGQNALGTSSVFMNNGYEAKPISTHAVDYKILAYQKATQKGIIDAIGFVYNQAGHTFYVLTFPGGNATWVYDLTTQLWHERGEWLNGQYNRWDPSSYCYYNKQHVVGSGSYNQLSVLDINYPVDDLVPSPAVNAKRWFRRWRAIGKAVNEPIRFGSLKLDMQTGVALGTGSSVLVGSVNITGTLPVENVGVPITYAYTVTGNFPPLIVTLTSGALPPGLALSTAGVVSGTCNVVGSYTFTLTVQDFYGNSASVTNTALVLGVTYWLTGNDNRLYRSNTLNFSASPLYTRNPFTGISTQAQGGYVQASPIVINALSSSVSQAIIETTNAHQAPGNITTTQKTVDPSISPARLRMISNFLILTMSGNVAYYYTSVDFGTTWVKQATPLSYNMTDVCRLSNGTWCADISFGGNQSFYYSTDVGVPINWVPCSGVSPSAIVNCIITNGTMAMKVNSLGFALVTSDGRVWANGNQVLPGGGNCYTGAYGNGSWVFCDTTNQTVYVSRNNGSSWVNVALGSGAITDMKYINNMFIATQGNAAYSSSNALVWTAIPLPTGWSQPANVTPVFSI